MKRRLNYSSKEDMLVGILEKDRMIILTTIARQVGTATKTIIMITILIEIKVMNKGERKNIGEV